MKILHIVAGDLLDGAARGAYGLHLSLRDKGIHSVILSNSSSSYGDDGVVLSGKTIFDKLKNYFRRKFDKIFIKFYKNRKNYIFSTGMIGIKFKKLSEYKEADIIHLHWINDGMINIKDFYGVNKPIVWTIRDMWPFTGGCHYAMQCKGYQQSCHYCPQLQAKSKNNLASFILKRKEKNLPKNIKLVGISHWITSKALESQLFKNFDVRTIFNNVNCDIFSPIEKSIARSALKINTRKKVILCGASKLDEFYKGLDHYISALEFLDQEKYFLCFFGNFDSEIIRNLGFEYISFGYLTDPVSLKSLYSSADVFIAPSIMEAFGKTLAESMSCGTPVVCFDATGPKDIVDHKVNGYRAEAFIPKDLANGIEWIVDSENYNELVNNAIQKAKNNFDSPLIAEQYIKLYRELL
ncbi:glycosyltransferase family 4 protein [Celerinatantimonas sp. YJH-8]|uniref:glycosyltransferase family 4 protein n=1 Tax=Celerinatantimonas sp. YJH-8 TaxID=3228714 RepID=UPI0038C64018